MFVFFNPIVPQAGNKNGQLATAGCLPGERRQHWPPRLVALQVQVDVGARLDHFSELPVSLVLVSLLCVDVVERIRPCRLIGH